MSPTAFYFAVTLASAVTLAYIIVPVLLLITIRSEHSKETRETWITILVVSFVLSSLVMIMLVYPLWKECLIFAPENSILLSDIDGIHNVVIRVSPKFSIIPIHKLSTTNKVAVVKCRRRPTYVQIPSFTSRDLINLSATAIVEYGGDPNTMIATIRWDGVGLKRVRNTVERTIVEFYQERDFLGTESERNDLHALIESKFPEELNIRCTFLEVRRQD